ncbi:MAG: GDP-mannose 4,6-dehydratase, partial [Nitrospirota bacterium]|nr:GDP-mannose 4,6-dehydratase [Nitrospirota bacterium]
GRYRRDWLSVFDHCSGIEFALLHGEPGTIYNVGGGNERENISVSQSILKHLDKPLSLIRYVQDRPGHDRRYAIDCTRLRTLGWTPTTSFEEGLRLTIDWYVQHDAWWRTIKSGEFRTYYAQAYGERLKGAGSRQAKV